MPLLQCSESRLPRLLQWPRGGWVEHEGGLLLWHIGGSRYWRDLYPLFTRPRVRCFLINIVLLLIHSCFQVFAAALRHKWNVRFLVINVQYFWFLLFGPACASGPEGRRSVWSCRERRKVSLSWARIITTQTRSFWPPRERNRMSDTQSLYFMINVFDWQNKWCTCWTESLLCMDWLL